MNKKIIMLITLLTVIIVSLFCVTAFADNGASKMTALKELGVFEEADASADVSAEMSRGVVLRVFTNLFAKNINGLEQIYDDVQKNTEYYDMAYTAYKMGLYLGRDGLLEANNSATLEDFAKTMVILSGYDFLTVKYEKYTYPYTAIAVELGVYPSKSLGFEKISYGKAAEAMYRLLLTEIPSVSYINSYTMYTNGTRSFMEAYLGAKCISGVVTANEYTSVNIERAAKNTIQINSKNQIYIINNADRFSNLIGHNVQAIYRDKDGMLEAIYVFADKNTEIYVDGDDFSGIDLKRRRISYYITEETRFDKKQIERTQVIPYNADIIYNGQYTDNSEYVFSMLADSEEYNIESVVFVDNDNDGDTDCLIIDVYKNYAVKFINTDEKTITDVWGNVYDFDDQGRFYNIISEDKSVDFSNIKVNSLLMVKEGLGKKPLVSVEIIDKSFLGSFYSLTINDEEAFAEISVGEPTNRGNEYVGSYVGGIDNQLHIERYIFDNMMLKHSDNILVGGVHMYRIFLDKKDRICSLDTFDYNNNTYSKWFMDDFSINTYATIEFGIGIRVIKESALSDILHLKVATIKKQLRTITVEEYVTSNECKILNIPSEIVQMYGSNWKKYDEDALTALFLNKLFEISFDEDGKINKITFPCEEITEGRLSEYNKPGQSYYYKGEAFRSLTTNDFFFTSKKQMCIQVPKAGTVTDIDSLYRITYFTTNSLIEGGIYKFNAYTFSKSSAMPEIIVMIYDYNTPPVVDRSVVTGVGIVKKSYEALSDNGFVNVYEAGGLANVSPNGKTAVLSSVYPVTYKTSQSATDSLSIGSLNTHQGADINSLSEHTDPIDSGDIVLFTLPYYNSTDSVMRYFTTAYKLYDYGTKSLTHITNGVTNGSASIVTGKIKKIDDTFFSLAVDGRGVNNAELADFVYNSGTSIRIYCYERLRENTKPSLKAGDRADLEEAMNKEHTVAIVGRQLIIVYKN